MMKNACLYIAIAVIICVALWFIFRYKGSEGYQEKDIPVRDELTLFPDPNPPPKEMPPVPFPNPPSPGVRQEIVRPKEKTLVLFAADWCGHCQHFKPVWDQIKQKLASMATQGGPSINAIEIDSKQASSYGIKGFPTVRLYEGRPSPTAQGKDYSGSRTLEDVIKFAMSP